jgi:hypothetical protein
MLGVGAPFYMWHSFFSLILSSYHCMPSKTSFGAKSTVVLTQ